MSRDADVDDESVQVTSTLTSFASGAADQDATTQTADVKKKRVVWKMLLATTKNISFDNNTATEDDMTNVERRRSSFSILSPQIPNKRKSLLKRLYKRLKTPGGAIRAMQVIFSTTELAMIVTVVALDPQLIAIWAWLIGALAIGVARAIYQLVSPTPPQQCFNGDIFFSILYALVCVSIGLMFHLTSAQEHNQESEEIIELLLFSSIGFGSVLSICYATVAIAEMFFGLRLNQDLS